MKKDAKIKTQSVAKAVLMSLAAAAVVGSVIVFPGMALVLDWVDKAVGQRRQTSRRAFLDLQRRGMVRIERQKSVVRLVLTEKGRGQVLKYRMGDLKIAKPSRWDGLWRLVMFDVPESLHSRRDLVRNKLVELGFSNVQKSVYIHPYPCREAIEVLREHYKLAPGQLYIFESRVLEGEEILRKHFKI
ncbi:MAG: hypothetical protein M1275_03490 [Patescibacteria group bacterium]|nr:hypothetical protein [Patescibacteria group bacterium]